MFKAWLKFISDEQTDIIQTGIVHDDHDCEKNEQNLEFHCVIQSEDREKKVWDKTYFDSFAFSETPLEENWEIPVVC